MKSGPLFSIVVPIYKVEKYLNQCIESILSQSFKDFELILVDDGSPDNCGKICDEYAAENLCIKVIHKPNGGVIDARKCGINNASGEYCLMIDGDDYVGSEHLQQIADIILKYSPDVVSFNAMRFDEKRGPFEEVKSFINSGLYTEEDIKSVLDLFMYDDHLGHLNSGCIPFALWSKAIRTSLMKDFQNKVPNNIKLGEDLMVLGPTLCNCKSLYILDAKTYFYRNNPTSIVNTFDENAVEKYIVLFEYLKKELPYVPAKNINVYIFNIIMHYVFQAIKNYSSYREYKKTLKKRITKDLILQIKKANPRNITLGDKVRMFLLKNQMYGVLWKIYKKR